MQPNLQKLYLLFFTSILLIITYSSYTLNIQTPIPPYSDFASYWDASLNPSAYLKGGVLIWIYRPFALLGLSATLSALIVNNLFLLVFSLAIYVPSSTIKHCHRLFSIALLIAFGIIFLGYCYLVNTDIPFAAATTLAVRLFTSKYKSLALLALFLSLTMRAQGALFFILTPFVFITTLPFLKIIHNQNTFASQETAKISAFLYNKKSISKVILISLIIPLAAIGVDSFLGKISDRSVDRAIHSRVTLYTGFIASGSTYPNCGDWTKHAINLTRSELDTPMTTILQNFLTTHTTIDIFQLFSCKLRRISSSHEFSAAYWRTASIMEANRLPGELVRIYYSIEFLISLALELFIIVSLCALFFRNRLIEFMLGLSFLISSIAVLTILEFQTRYLLGVIFPMAGYLLLALRKDETAKHLQD
ncbi:hypothetical protein [Jeongeupia chitinilytica]|uniref:hypothetical protein n=1 Tax=Jeongeupia chitinilytica TaxID=1041641 RepID=UPI00167646F5|nr:hypothetical protein [Jeongeupia chitinilytica]